MPTLKVNEIISYSGNTLSLGTSGDTVSIPANTTFNVLSGNVYIPNGIVKLDAITASNTSTYNLTLNSSPYSPGSANACLVSLNGVIQAPTNAYTISGSTITFASALTSTDTIDFITALAAPYTVNVPANGSVGLSQLSATGTASSSTFLRGDNSWSQVGLTTGVTGTLPIANGGTNLTTYTTGDLLYASNATTLTKLGIGSSGQALTVSGGIPAWGTSGPSAGQVIQVLSATDSTQRSTTSTSFVTGSNTLSVTITPSNSSSKFIIMATVSSSMSYNLFAALGRNGTILQGSSSGLGGGGAVTEIPITPTWYDSPATASAITYQLYFRVDGGTGIINVRSTPGSIIVMEVKG